MELLKSSLRKTSRCASAPPSSGRYWEHGKDPLNLLKRQSIAIDTKELVYTDTSEAWACLRAYYPRAEEENDAEASKQQNQKKTALRSLNGILQDDGSTDEAARFDYKMWEKRRELPSYLSYENVFTTKRDKACFYCNPSHRRRGVYHGCRICNRIYHEECVRMRGYCSDELSDIALSESVSLVGWSCPDCENLFKLLSEEEKEQVMDIFDTVAGDDGVIDINEFLQMQRDDYHKLLGTGMPAFREKIELDLFRKIDRDSTGTVEWWEFMPYMAVRFLRARSSLDLLKLLSEREVDNFKEHFIVYDINNKGSLPQSKAQLAYIDWYASIVKTNLNTTVDKNWYGGDLDLEIHGLTRQHNKIKHEREISWDEYLEKCALSLIAARPNTVHQKPFIPPMPSFLYDHTGEEIDHKLDYDELKDLCTDVSSWTTYIKEKIAKNNKDRRMREKKMVELEK